MLDIFTVVFFGHRYIENPLDAENKIKEYAGKLISQKEYVNFLVGRNGEFDVCVSSSIKRAQKEYGNNNSSLTLMLPYVTAEYSKNKKYFEEYYDYIEISHTASKAHPKSAIQLRNREMVDKADMVICYIERNEGGAYNTVKYAVKMNKLIINLADNK